MSSNASWSFGSVGSFIQPTTSWGYIGRTGSIVILSSFAVSTYSLTSTYVSLIASLEKLNWLLDYIINYRQYFTISKRGILRICVCYIELGFWYFIEIVQTSVYGDRALKSSYGSRIDYYIIICKEPRLIVYQCTHSPFNNWKQHPRYQASGSYGPQYSSNNGGPAPPRQ